MSHSRINLRRSKTDGRADRHVLWLLGAICTSLLLFAAFAIVWVNRAEEPQKSDIPVVALRETQDLHLDPSKLGDHQLHLFEVRASKQEVKFVVERTEDKTVHVALATCRICYRSQNRHFAKQGQMICGKCNGPMIFESKDQKAGANQCTLAEIAHAETDRDVIVSARDVLAQGAKLAQ